MIRDLYNLAIKCGQVWPSHSRHRVKDRWYLLQQVFVAGHYANNCSSNGSRNVAEADSGSGSGNSGSGKKKKKFGAKGGKTERVAAVSQLSKADLQKEVERLQQSAADKQKHYENVKEQLVATELRWLFQQLPL